MEKQNIKTTRASQTRAKTEKPKVWTPPSSLAVSYTHLTLPTSDLV